jgi:poly [ADP-ribose] polymerase
MIDLSGDFYTAIPHRIGRTRDGHREAVIDTMEDFQAKQETLQLMKDMLQVNGDGWAACSSTTRSTSSTTRSAATSARRPRAARPTAEIEQLVLRAAGEDQEHQGEERLHAPPRGEHEVFTQHIGNQRLLFHGSRIKNWVGILSRGILLPKIVVSMGVNRTDAGWLGNGIYFGDAACTSAFYTTPGA